MYVNVNSLMILYTGIDLSATLPETNMASQKNLTKQ